MLPRATNTLFFMKSGPVDFYGVTTAQEYY